MDTDTTVPVIIFKLSFLLCLIFVNALFSVMEITIISMNKLKINKLDENNYTNTNIINKVLANSNIYIASIQFIKILITIFSSTYAVINILPHLIKAISSYNQLYSQIISVVIMIFLLAYFIFAFGEVLPKKVALINPEKAPFFLLRPIYYLSSLVYPIVKFISITNNFILKLFHQNSGKIDANISEDEIKALVETASENGVFNDIEKEMINSIFSFDDITAKDIMVSRKDTYKIDINEPLESYLDEAIKSYYSRIPVYRENIDDIIGILNIKDLLLEARKVGFENIQIENLLQKPYFVPEMKSIDELFRDMQRLRNHMAILVDEYGGFSGIVTIEDLVEEVMGEINDEFDDEENNIIKISDNKYTINGTTELREINKELNLNLENENYDTISALIIEHLGYIPNKYQKPTVQIGNLYFKVDLASENRIQKLTLTIKDVEDKSSDTNNKNIDNDKHSEKKSNDNLNIKDN